VRETPTGASAGNPTIRPHSPVRETPTTGPVRETPTTSISREGRPHLTPPSLATPIADADDGATNLTAAVSPKLIWTKPIVRELFGEEKRRLLSALAT
jgi:hypothetical protein